MRINNMTYLNQDDLNAVVKAQAEIYKPAIQKMMSEAESHDCHQDRDNGCPGCPKAVDGE